MMHETELDPRIGGWLRDGPPGASGWVLDGVLEHVTSHPRRSLRARWSAIVDALRPRSGVLPALRPLLIVGAALAIAGGGLIYAGSQGLLVAPTSMPSVAPSPTVGPDVRSLPVELQGSWHATLYTHSGLTLTLEPCAVGESCGSFDDGERCHIPLVYRSGDEDRFVFERGTSEAAGCGWIPGASGEIEVSPRSDGHAVVVTDPEGDTVWMERGTTAPSARQPETTISEYHSAWHRGMPSLLPQLRTDDFTLHVTGDTSRLVEGSRHFEVLSGARGWVYWETRGTPVGQGAYWLQASVSGAFDPGNHDISVFRLDRDGRLADQWTITVPSSGSSHESIKAASASAELEAFLDGCLESLGRGDAAAYAACHEHVFADQVAWRVSAEGVGGAWTEEHIGRDAVQSAAGRSAYGLVERTAPAVVIQDLVAYPFRASSSDTCREGVDVIRLDVHGDRIAEHWTFCGGPSGATSLTPSEVIDGNLKAWHAGDASKVPEYYAPNATLLYFPTGGLTSEPNPFEIAGGRAWETWERRGDAFHAGPYWAHAMRHGVFEYRNGFAVYRFDERSRIEVEWVMLWGGQGRDISPPGPADPAIVAFIDGCRSAGIGSGSDVARCYGPDAGVYVSADSATGDWTEQYQGPDEVASIPEGAAYGRVVRSGDATMIGDWLAFPFHGDGSPSCDVGIDVIQLELDADRIRNEWVLCGHS